MPSLVSSYLKPWRRSAPRAGVASSEEWEELGRELSDREDAEEADAVVVGADAPPPPKAQPKQLESEATLDASDDGQPFALLRLRIRPASAAFWGSWWATAVLLLTSGMLGGIVAHDATPAVRLSSAAAGANASRELRGEYKGVVYACTPVVAERAAPEPAASVLVPPAEASAAPAPSLPEAPVAIPLPVFFAPLSAADVAELATWLRRHGRGALADASSHAGPLARRAGAAAHRAGSAALDALDSAGRGVATGSGVAVQRSSTPHIISIVMEQLRSGMRAARLPRRMPFEALRAHAASRLFE